ncbi:MAG: PD40 domain-containing protein [Elusimicrobia bacterium]|nr:PD40 domain-containing protein [Elusimicrobiota bacterium]
MRRLVLTLLLSPPVQAAEPAFGPPRAVELPGYDADVMEPFVSKDGRWLFFNDSNAPGHDTDIFFAERVAPERLVYKGRLPGANSPKLDGIPSMDEAGWFYLTSGRSYDKDRVSIYRGRFRDGALGEVEPVPGLSLDRRGWINMGAQVDAGGDTLLFADTRFGLLGLFGIPAWSDLALARREGKGFVRDPDSARILARLNTHELEYGGVMSVDGLEVFFTRTRVPFLLVFGKVRFQIMRATRSDPRAPFGEPTALLSGREPVEGPTLTRDGRWLYFHKKVGDRHRLFVMERD